MDFSQVKDGMRIQYIGKSLAFGGTYLVIPAESTYKDEQDCPENERGKLMIIEFTNNDKPMFFTLDRLDPNEWKMAE